MNIFVLTGAGISAESGLGTFRSNSAADIWAQFDPLKHCTPEGFAADPDEVYAFYNARRRDMIGAEPNPAHFALARLESGLAARGDALFLVAQNIDDLHERAGAGRVLHMHGELLKARCLACGQVSPWRDDLGGEDVCPSCGRAGRLRPHVVWFGEMPLRMMEIEEGLAAADRFVSIGTSGAVYPAAGFVQLARSIGVPTCEINLEPSDTAIQFDQRRYGPASETVPGWIDEVLER